MPDELYLYNWSDYMPASVKKDFEKETGIKVVETYFDDNEALLAKLKAGATGYDVDRALRLHGAHHDHVRPARAAGHGVHPQHSRTSTSSSKPDVRQPELARERAFSTRSPTSGARPASACAPTRSTSTPSTRGASSGTPTSRARSRCSTTSARLPPRPSSGRRSRHGHAVLDQHAEPGRARRRDPGADRAEAARARLRLGQHEALDGQRHHADPLLERRRAHGDRRPRRR